GAHARRPQAAAPLVCGGHPEPDLAAAAPAGRRSPAPRAPPRTACPARRPRRRSVATRLSIDASREGYGRRRCGTIHGITDSNRASRPRPDRKVMRVRRLVARWQVSASGARTALRRPEGPTMAEYGVVLAVITLVVVVALTTLSTNIRNGISGIAAMIPG